MDEQPKQMIIKKKNTHFFETYISKVLKQISPSNGITSNAKQQLNSFLCILLKFISSKVLFLTTLAKKKTISIKEVENALKIILDDELLSMALKEGSKSCESFKNIENKGNNSSRQTKANIIFPPSIVEKFLRNFVYSKIMISSLVPVYLASVLEYIAAEILDISVFTCKQNKHIRITVRDLELSVRHDNDFDLLFKKLNISFLGGGVVPYIHTSLLNNKKHKKKKDKDKENNNKETTKNHRFRYGTIAIKNIKKQQKTSDTLILSKSPFEKLVRHIFNQHYPKGENNVKISKDVFIIIQHFIEQYIVNLLKNANFLAIHAGRVKLIPTDIFLINSFLNHAPNPYSSNKQNVELLMISQDDAGLDEQDDNEEDLEEEENITTE